MSTFQNTCDVIIEGGIVALLVFSPACFGATHPIAFSVLQAAVFVLALVWVLKVGLYEPSGPEPRRWKPVELCIAAFAIYGLLQWLSIASFLPGTVCGHATRMALCKVLTYGVAFLMVIGNLAEQARLRRLATTIVCIGAIMALLGIVQIVTSMDSIYWWRQPAGEGKPFGPYVTNAHFAGYMVMALPLALCAALARRERKGGAGGSRGGILPLAAALVMLIALLLCGAAEGMVAFLASALFLLGLLLVTGGKKAKVIGGIVGVVCLIALWWVLAPMVVGGAVIGSGKASVWRGAARMWLDSPVWGVGVGAFANAFPMYKSAVLGSADIATAASELLQTLAEVGVVGFIIAMVFFGVWWVRCVRSWRAGETPWERWTIAGGMMSAAGMLAFGLLSSCFRVPANALTFAVILGIAYALAETVNVPASQKEDPAEEE